MLCVAQEALDIYIHRTRGLNIIIYFWESFFGASNNHVP